MLQLRKILSTLTENQTIGLLSIIAAMLAWRVLYIQQGWINDDSVLYFEMARLFSIGAWHEGLALFQWPLYPILIAALHKITGFSYQLSAQFLSVVFFSLTTFSLATLIQLAGGNKRTILMGSLLLWSSLYITGDVLGMLLRDQGFWAFFLTSLVFFTRFYRSESMTEALLWQITAIIATLFRVEAITYLAFLPTILLLKHKINCKTKLLLLLKAHALNILLLSFIGSAIFIFADINLSSFGRLQEVFDLFSQNSNGILSTFNAKSHQLGSVVLGSFLDEYASLSLVMMLLTIVFIKCATTAGWLPLILTATKFKCPPPLNSAMISSAMDSDAKKIFYWVAILAAVNAIVIIFRTYVLSGRYVISFGFIVILFAAFVLADLWQASGKSRLKKQLFAICIIIISLFLIKNMWAKPDGYNSEQDAARYVQTLQKNPTRVFYVSPRLRYYAGVAFNSRGYDYWTFINNAIQDKSIQKYDILVLNMPNDNQKTQILSNALTNFKLSKEFYGVKKRKKVMIFERIAPNP